MKTKRLIARIMCVLMLALLSASLLTVPAFAAIVHTKDINGKDWGWAASADLGEVKSELKSLQKYLLPMDDDNYDYSDFHIRGGGTNQKDADGYSNLMKYTIEMRKAHPVERYLALVTRTRMDLTLPDLPVLDYRETHVAYSVSRMFDYTKWDEIGTYPDAQHGITSVGGYPAKGYWSSDKDIYKMELYVDLRELLPWAKNSAGGSAIIHFLVDTHREESVDTAAEIGNTILNWQPTVSEPVVIEAETDPD